MFVHVHSTQRPRPPQTAKNSQEETLTLLSWNPDRLGHATFLDASAMDYVIKHKIPIEMCLTSNLLYGPIHRLSMLFRNGVHSRLILIPDAKRPNH